MMCLYVRLYVWGCVCVWMCVTLCVCVAIECGSWLTVRASVNRSGNLSSARWCHPGLPPDSPLILVKLYWWGWWKRQWPWRWRSWWQWWWQCRWQWWWWWWWRCWCRWWWRWWWQLIDLVFMQNWFLCLSISKEFQWKLMQRPRSRAISSTQRFNF